MVAATSASDVMSSPSVVLDDEGAHDRFSHLVLKDRAEAGRPVTALCGKVWVPRMRPGSGLCPKCKEIFDNLPDDDDDGSPDRRNRFFLPLPWSGR